MTATNVTIWCHILRRSQSGAAVEIEADDGQRHWLPVSQLARLPGEHHWSKPLPLEIPEWLATQKGLV